MEAVASLSVSRANHSWLVRLHFATWLLPATILLQTTLLMLAVIAPWTLINYGWQWPVYLSSYAIYLNSYLPAVSVVAFWLATTPAPMPEPVGEPKAAPARARARARWLAITAFLIPLVFAVLPPVLQGNDRMARVLVSAIASAYLLTTLRSYANQFGDLPAARLLHFAAILAIVAAATGLLSALLLWVLKREETWPLFLLVPLAVPVLAFALVQLWALIRFAIGLSRILRQHRPLLRHNPVIVSSLAAIVLGGAAGTVAQYIMLVQMQRAKLELAGPVLQVYWMLPSIGIVVAAALLPQVLQKSFHSYNRHRG